MEMDTRKIISLGDYNTEEDFKRILRTSKVLDVIISYDHYSKYYTAMKVLEEGSKVPQDYLNLCEKNGLKGKSYIFEKGIDGDIWVFKMYI